MQVSHISMLVGVFMLGIALGFILLEAITVPMTDRLRETVGKLETDIRYLRKENSKLRDTIKHNSS